MTTAIFYFLLLIFGLILFFIISYLQLRRVAKEVEEEEALGESVLTRDLTEFDITMVGVGAMIGAGIFVLTGIAAGFAGPALIFAFLLNGFLTFLTAAAYAELGSAVPEAGGGYLWVKSAMGNYQAFLSGWMSWFAHVVAGSLYALGFGSYFAFLLTEAHIIPEYLKESATVIIAIIIILTFAFINFMGSSETGKVGNLITITKLIIIGIFILSGLWVILTNFSVQIKNFDPFFPNGITAMFMAMGLTFIAFEGHEIIVQTGEEVLKPRRSIPRAIFKAIMIVIPIYCLVAITAIGAITVENGSTWKFLGEAGELGIAEAAKQFMPLGATLLLFGGLISTLSALNATIYSSARVSFVMGRDKLLPPQFGKVNFWRRTPHIAIIGSSIIMILIVILLPIRSVAAAADVMFLLLFLQVNLSLYRIRKKYSNRLNYGYKIPWFPFIPFMAIAGKIFILIFLLILEPIAITGTLIWIFLGTALWFLYSKKNIQKYGFQDSFKNYFLKS